MASFNKLRIKWSYHMFICYNNYDARFCCRKLQNQTFSSGIACLLANQKLSETLLNSETVCEVISGYFRLLFKAILPTAKHHYNGDFQQTKNSRNKTYVQEGFFMFAYNLSNLCILPVYGKGHFILFLPGGMLLIAQKCKGRQFQPGYCTHVTLILDQKYAQLLNLFL